MGTKTIFTLPATPYSDPSPVREMATAKSSLWTTSNTSAFLVDMPGLVESGFKEDEDTKP